MKKCPKCNKSYDDSWEICLKCGEKLEKRNVPDRNKSEEKQKELTAEEIKNIRKQVGVNLAIAIGGMLLTIGIQFVPAMDVIVLKESNFSLGEIIGVPLFVVTLIFYVKSWIRSRKLPYIWEK